MLVLALCTSTIIYNSNKQTNGPKTKTLRRQNIMTAYKVERDSHLCSKSNPQFIPHIELQSTFNL